MASQSWFSFSVLSLCELGNMKVLYIPAKGWYWESSSRLEDLTAIGPEIFFRIDFSFDFKSFCIFAFKNFLRIILLEWFFKAKVHNLFFSIKWSNSSVATTIVLGILIIVDLNFFWIVSVINVLAKASPLAFPPSEPFPIWIKSCDRSSILFENSTIFDLLLSLVEVSIIFIWCFRLFSILLKSFFLSSLNFPARLNSPLEASQLDKWFLEEWNSKDSPGIVFIHL